MPVLLSAKAAKMNTLAVEPLLDSMTLAFVEGRTKGIPSSESMSILLLIDIAFYQLQEVPEASEGLHLAGNAFCFLYPAVVVSYVLLQLLDLG